MMTLGNMRGNGVPIVIWLCAHRATRCVSLRS
jgi:hypothetical protein